MFDHLDDPEPHSLGTDHQLAAVRKRGRALVQHRRRNRLAAGSAAVAATAGVTAVAVVGLPTRSVAGTAADASTTPFASPSPTASAAASSPTPAPVPASSTAAPVAVPAPADATVSAVPVSPTAETASPTAATIAATLPTTPTAAPTPAVSTCATVTSDLKNVVLPVGFTPLVPPAGVASWYHAGAAITSIVVTVNCSAFDPRQVPAGTPVKDVTVLGIHEWLIGDPATGTLQLTWNATAATAVTVVAQVTLPEQTGQVEDQLLALSKYLAE